jgi:hypothetical protein
MSDAASAIWVPTFYSALVVDPAHDDATALRAAQMRLRESRMFRHPFYWSGLETFSRTSFSVRRGADAGVDKPSKSTSPKS